MAEVLSRRDFENQYGLLREFGYGHAYVPNDDTLQIRHVMPSLRYDNGSRYEYRKYHNVLFTKGRLPRDVLAEVGQRVRLADAPASVAGSGLWMADEERSSDAEGTVYHQ